MDREILNLAYKILIIVSIVFVAFYLPRVIGWFGALRKNRHYHNPIKNKIAILIPARNEGEAIIPLLASLQKQDYDHDYFDVHVIVKDKNDPAIKFTKDMIDGFTYVANEQKSKADALDFALKDILSKNPDAYESYVIVDADCMLDAHFVSAMNDALATKKDIICGKKLVKNYLLKQKGASSLSGDCNGLIWTIIDELGNRYKSAHNLTIMTISTGVMIHKSLIQKWEGWPYHQTMTEDMELQRDAALNHYSTLYNPDAVLYLEEAKKLNVTNKRRQRWMSGLIKSDRIYREEIKNLSFKSLKEKINYYYIYSLYIVYWYIGYLLLGGMAYSFAALTFFGFSNPIAADFLTLGLIHFGLIYLAFLFLTLAILLAEGKRNPLPWYRKLVLLFVHPLFYMGYIKIVSKALFSHKAETWESIDRVNFQTENRGE